VQDGAIRLIDAIGHLEHMSLELFWSKILKGEGVGHF
jgi:hypothetical protein